MENMSGATLWAQGSSAPFPPVVPETPACVGCLHGLFARQLPFGFGQWEAPAADVEGGTRERLGQFFL